MIRPNDTIKTGDTVANIQYLKKALLDHIELYRKSILKTKGEGSESAIVNELVENFQAIWVTTGFEKMAEEDLNNGVKEMAKSGQEWISSATALMEERKKNIA